MAKYFCRCIVFHSDFIFDFNITKQIKSNYYKADLIPESSNATVKIDSLVDEKKVNGI